jgi:hypothetical protein
MNRNKELEALEELKKIDIIIDGCAWNYKDTNYKESFDVLEKYLTPPTADEVIKALSEYYGRKVVFRDNAFWYKTIIYDNEQWVREVSLKDLSKDNRGDLITMIGKFYESLEAEK